MVPHNIRAQIVHEVNTNSMSKVPWGKIGYKYNIDGSTCKKVYQQMHTYNYTNARWSRDEKEKLLSEVKKYASRKCIPWKRIARKLPGRSNTACRQKYAELTKKGSMSIQTPGLDEFKSKIIDENEKKDQLKDQLNEHMRSYINRALDQNVESFDHMKGLVDAAKNDISSMLENTARIVFIKAVSARA